MNDSVVGNRCDKSGNACLSGPSYTITAGWASSSVSPGFSDLFVFSTPATMTRARRPEGFGYADPDRSGGNLEEHSGIRGRVAELCYSSGALHSLQRVRSWWQKDLRILAYHRVMPLPDPATFDFDLELISTSPERFRVQMQRLKQHFRPLRLTDVVAALNAGDALPPDAVVVTFDDGYDDNYRIAYPILRELGIPATFFVSTGHIDSGKPFAYDWLVHMIFAYLCTTTCIAGIGHGYANAA